MDLLLSEHHCNNNIKAGLQVSMTTKKPSFYLSCLIRTVELGYNEHAYNEFHG